MWFLVLVILIIVAVIVKKSLDANKVSVGGYDDTIRLIINYYDQARNNLESLGANVIAISTFWFETDGRIDSSSAFMSVCVQEGTNDALAESIGMKVDTLCGRKYYQFVIRRKFSKTVKSEILKKTLEELSQTYPNDVFKVNDSIPALYSMVDCKDAMDLLNSVNNR